jgi:hypothetical protein
VKEAIVSNKKSLSDPPTDKEIIKFFKERSDHPMIDDTIQPGVPQPVRLQLAPIICFRCRKRIKAVRGYVYGEAFIPLIDVSDQVQVTALVEDLRKRDPDITPVDMNYSKTVNQRYFSATCPHCSMLCGDFFMTDEFFMEKTLCEPHGCGCNNPDVDCEMFEHHPLSLRLHQDEIDQIRFQNS